MKRNLTLSVVFGLLISIMLVGCSFSKKAVGTSDFKSACKDADLDIEDISDYYDEDGYEKVICAYNDDYEIYFFDIDTEDHAETLFEYFCDDVDSYVGKGGSSSTSMNGTNYATYKKKGKSRVAYTCYVEDTVLYVEADEDSFETINEIIKTLGY